MDTRIKANNVEINLRMNEEPTYLPGRGYAHIADVLSNSDRIELTIALIGLELWGQKVTGIEMFGIENQQGKPISLLINKKLW